MNHPKAIAAKMMTARMTPMPIPAFAPVDSTAAAAVCVGPEMDEEGLSKATVVTYVVSRVERPPIGPYKTDIIGVSVPCIVSKVAYV